MSKIKTSNNIPLSSLGQVWQKGKVLVLSALLLFSTQALVSAKTLLEQYLNCDGIEEFVFYLEYIGQTNQFPTRYWSGSYQDGNFLSISSLVPMRSIPEKLSPESSYFVTSHYEQDWWVISANLTGYDRKIWEEKDIPEEENNQVHTQCLGDLSTVCDLLLNYGLYHSSENMTLDTSTYTNMKTHISVDYSVVEKNEEGMPVLILAKSVNLTNGTPPVTWKKEIKYSSNEKGVLLPTEIQHSSVYQDGTEKLKSRVVIEKLVPATEKLSKEHFMRPTFSDTTGFPNQGEPTTYYVRSNQLVGLNSASKEVIRMQPDDPRILRLPAEDKKSFTLGYWIGGILLLGAVLGSFLAAKRSKHEADVNNNK